MIFIANTRVGVIRRVARDLRDVYVLECPLCRAQIALDDDQWHGRSETSHGASCASGYRATHNFAAAVAVAGGFRSV